MALFPLNKKRWIGYEKVIGLIAFSGICNSGIGD